jgi:hypothetical protein
MLSTISALLLAFPLGIGLPLSLPTLVDLVPIASPVPAPYLAHLFRVTCTPCTLILPLVFASALWCPGHAFIIPLQRNVKER